MVYLLAVNSTLWSSFCCRGEQETLVHWGASGDQSGPVQVAVTVSLWNQEQTLY